MFFTVGPPNLKSRLPEGSQNLDSILFAMEVQVERSGFSPDVAGASRESSFLPRFTVFFSSCVTILI